MTRWAHVLAVAGLMAVAGAQGDRSLPAPVVRMTTDKTYRYVTSNGIPDHEPGRFPNPHNPGRIAAQDWHFRVKLRPTTAPSPIDVRHDLFGVAVNGVPFDPATAEFYQNDRRSIWNMEAIGTKEAPAIRDLGLDYASAHVQPGGIYHYHALPLPLLKNLGGADGSKMTLIGYAADGFPIYAPFGYGDPMDAKSEMKELRSSYRLRDGTRPSGDKGPGGKYDGRYTPDWVYVKGSGDLDECDGRFGVTPEHPEGTYYYVLTADYPFVPRKWRGDPDESFLKQPPPGGMGMGPPGGPPGMRGGGPPGGRPPRR